MGGRRVPGVSGGGGRSECVCVWGGEWRWGVGGCRG